MGALIFLNGLLSYMADTHTFGYPSAWRAADSYVATFNTILQFVLILLQIIGPMSFPRDMVTVFTASLLIAIGCKRRAVLCGSQPELGYGRWRGIATPSRRRSYGKHVASMAWGARNLIPLRRRRRLRAPRPRRVPRLARAVARRAARGRGRGAAALGAIAPRCDPLT